MIVAIDKESGARIFSVTDHGLEADLVAGAAHAQGQLRPIKTEHYRPFAITSAKLKTETPDKSVEISLAM